MRRAEDLGELWGAALGAWLEAPSETTRAEAYALGRRALAEGIGLVAMSELHARTVAQLAPDSPQKILRAWQFLCEALGPSDLALRGYREAVDQLQRLNQSLEERVEQRSRDLVSAITENQTFRLTGSYHTTEELGRALAAGRLDVGVVVPYDYARLRARGRPATVLHLTAKDQTLPFTKASIWVDDRDGLVRQFEYTEPSGLVRRVTIEGMRVNPAVSASVFEFEVPRGVRVVEGR